MTWSDLGSPVAGKIGPGEIDKVIGEAIARFDPEKTAEEMVERWTSVMSVRAARNRTGALAHLISDTLPGWTERQEPE